MCWVGSKERCGRDSVEWFVLTHGFELILSVGEGCMSPLLYVKAAPEPPPPLVLPLVSSSASHPKPLPLSTGLAVGCFLGVQSSPLSFNSWTLHFSVQTGSHSPGPPDSSSKQAFLGDTHTLPTVTSPHTWVLQEC